MLSWACELWHVPDILSELQGIAFWLTCLLSKTLQKMKFSPTLSTCVHRHLKKIHAQVDSKQNGVPHDCSASVSRVCQCLAEKLVFHITAVLHITVVSDINCAFRLSGFYLVWNKTCKTTLVSSCQKKRLHIPLSNLTGDVWRRAKQKQFHLPRKSLKETHAHAGQKKTSIWL